MLNDAYYFVNKYPLLSNEIFNNLINLSECLKDENLMDFYEFYTLCLNLNLNLDNLNYLKNISNYLNEDLINKFLDLNKKYPSLNKEKFDKLKDLYNYLKQQNSLQTIQLSFLNTPSNIKLNIDQFATLFNFHKKGLFKKDYDKNTKDLYQQYLDVLNAIQLLQMQLSSSDFLEIFDILQLNDAKKLFVNYLSLTQYLKEHNLTIENYFSLLKYFNHESYLTKFNDFIDFFNLLKKSNISIEEYKNITSYFNNQVFKQNFDKYCLLFNTLKYLNINFEDFNKIEDILNNDTYLNLFIDFDKPYEHLPKPNPFSSDLEFLVYEQALKFEEKVNNLNEEDKKEFLKMKGKIEKAAAMPEKFLLAYKDLLKNIFPVFISNPDKLASFIDFKNDQYDYVIFDEASQIFLEKAIPYLSIAKKVIIAGDNQQMQPTN
ncbi:hypothetical protein J6P59_01140 [bacterium]|nr:hypothetical protein [bacterium]